MPGVLGGEPLVQEHVAQMSPAIGAGDLRAPAVGVHLAMHGVSDGVVEAGPTATGVELVLRLVERGVASLAEVGAPGPVLFVLPGKRSFGAHLQDDAVFFVVERVVFHGGISCESG